MDTIDFEEPRYSACPCCGAKITNLTRFVTRDGGAFAVYYATFSDGPDHNEVQILAGFGDWSKDAPQERRIAFAFKIWPTEAEFVTTIVNAKEGEWKTGFLGSILSREEALKHEWLGEVYELSSHITRCDEPVTTFLNSVDIRRK
jgi:hypothetical protein